MPLDERVLVSESVRLLDLVGTFVFALSGAVAGVEHRLDLFGVLVLSFAAAIQDWRYITLSLLAGLVTYFWTLSLPK